MVKRRAKKKSASAQSGQPTGSTTRVGAAYLFLFPFDIYHMCSAGPVTITVEGVRAEIYPPHPDNGKSTSSLPQVRLQNVPMRPGTTAPWIKAPALKTMGLSLSWSKDAVRGDAMRVNWFGADSPGSASEFVDRTLSLIRMFTMQWWITRDRRPDEGYIRNVFAINELGERLEGVMSLAKKYGGFRIEKVMSDDMFSSALWFAARKFRPLLAFDSMFDAIYHLGVGDIRRMALDAAIACEIILEEYPRLHDGAGGIKEKDIKRAMRRQFEHRIDDGVKDLFGKSFKHDCPDEAEWLEALWIYRNNVAHGQPPKLKHRGIPRVPTAEDHTSMMKAVIRLFTWLQQFGQFRPLPAAGPIAT